MTPIGRKIFFVGTIFFVLGACFGHVDKRGSVIGYTGGVVKTEGGEFQIGVPGPFWKKKKFNYRAVLFSHIQFPASISVDAFCKGSFDDAPLKILTHQLLYALSKKNVKREESVALDERQALRTLASGTLDGVSVLLDTVVLKMNECVFDFVLVSEPSFHEKTVKDFENVFKGFHYIRGPHID